jgi:hypothetical protein
VCTGLNAKEKLENPVCRGLGVEERLIICNSCDTERDGQQIYQPGAVSGLPARAL